MATAGRHQGARAAVWLGLGLGLGAAGGCLQIEPFQCLDDGDCVHQGRPGQCRLAEGTCIYPDESCDTRWSAASGECMPPVGVGQEDGSVGDDSASGVDPSATSAGTGTGGSTTTTGPVTTGDPSVDCTVGTDQSLTAQGVVWASSVFSDNFHAFLGADGDLGTSWFSSGPENGGPSLYTWTVLEPLCISGVRVTGNGLHEVANFRTDYGFESLNVRVYDHNDQIVFQQMLGMEGTPDPPIFVAPLVAGVRVELELFEHESSDCGGFSELEITGFPLPEG